MKFLFCGMLDAPDWLLMEMGTLSQVSVPRFKLLCQQVIESLEGGEIDFRKVQKIFKDAPLSPSDLKAVIASLEFVLGSASRYDVEETVLSSELQQLGLPEEHSDALCAPYLEKKDLLRMLQQQDSLRLPRLEKLDWRVDYIASSSLPGDAGVATVGMRITKDDGEPPVAFEMSADKFAILHSELKQARALMDGAV